MLTHTDVHLLVGMLSLITSPEDVDVELGARVFDEASDTERDVDVVISARHSKESIVGYAAIEVKDESKPLDTPTVEQLIAKLRDMPSITQCSIVSASGYTGPAKKKAAHYNVDLLTLREWKRGERVYPFLVPDLAANIETFLVGWVRRPNIRLITDVNGEHQIPSSAIVLAPDGSPVALGHLLDSLADQELTRLNEEGKFSDLLHEATRAIVHEVPVKRPLKVFVGSKSIRILGFELAGDVYAIRKRETPTMKLLVNEASGMPHAACLVGILPTNDLCGVVFTPEDLNPHMVKISVSDRNLKVINRLKLPRRVRSER